MSAEPVRILDPLGLDCGPEPKEENAEPVEMQVRLQMAYLQGKADGYNECMEIIKRGREDCKGRDS